MTERIPHKDDLPFEISVYRKRLSKLREEMGRRNIEVLILHSPENLYYLCGYNTPGYYYGYQSLIISIDKDPFMVLRRVEESNVRGRSWLSKWYIYTDTDDPIDSLIDALESEKMDRKRIGINRDTRFLTPKQYEKMISSLPHADVVDGYGLVEDLRRIKSSQEIDYIKQAVRAAEAAMSAGVEASLLGNTEDDVAAAVYNALIESGSEYPGMPPMIAAGYRSGLAHTTWEGHKRIESQDMILLEIAAAVKRYHAVLGRAVIIGKPSDRQSEIEKVVLDAGDAAMEKIRPGITAADADSAQRDVISKAGYADHFLHRTAYGLGIAYPPHWDEGAIMSLKPNNMMVLEPNMVFHLVSALYFYAEFCLPITETVRVTEDGCEKLTNFPRKLFVH